MSGRGADEDRDNDAGAQSGSADGGGGGRDYGDSAGYGGGGAALDYDEVLGETGRGRKLDNNPLDEVIPPPDRPTEEDIRSLAYSKSEQAGRPEGRENEFWAEAERQLG